MLGREPAARGQRHRADAHVLAGTTAVGAELEPRRNDHRAILDAHVLLHEHGVGARRHGRAGEDTHRLTRPDRLRRGMSGRDAVDHREARLAGGGEVGVTDGKAVDGGIVERRQVDGGNEIGGEHAAGSFVQIQPLGLAHRRDALREQPLDVIDRKQRPAEREAIVGKLRHHRLP